MTAVGHREPPGVTVVVVNYNGCDDTRECLRSLRDVEYGNRTVILVDNASTDGSFERLREEFPEVLCIRSGKNLGFTGGNNLGLAKAYEARPEFVFLLNNDTVVSPDILRELTGFMENHPRVGLAGPLIYEYEARDVIAFGGGHLDRNSGLVTFLNKGKCREELGEAPIYCSFIEGSALFFRTAVLRRIGGFNDLYFLTSEESELCVRVADLGYEMAVLPSCGVWHKISRSMVAGSELANYFLFRNRMWFIRRNSREIGVRDLIRIVRYCVICLVSFAVRKRNLPAARGILCGIVDFAKGVQGPGRYKARLNA
ncbi:MAG: glycosyltransferase family 2 protein [Candidatus Deferrimicrobium sp.]